MLRSLGVVINDSNLCTPAFHLSLCGEQLSFGVNWLISTDLSRGFCCSVLLSYCLLSPSWVTWGQRWARLRTDRSAEWDDLRVQHGCCQFCNPNCWVKLHTAVSSSQVRPSSFLKFHSQSEECGYKNSSLEGVGRRVLQVVETMLRCPLVLKNVGPQWSQVLSSPRSQPELSGRACLL